MDRTALHMFTVLLMVLLVSLVTSTTLKCYKCDSGRHGDLCGRDFRLTSSNTSYVVAGCGSCMKTVIKDVEPHVYIRNCTKATTFKLGCTKKYVNNRGSAEQCSCTDNLCNGARSEVMALAVVLFMSLVAYTLYQLHGFNLI